MYNDPITSVSETHLHVGEALSMYNDPIRSVSETHLHVGEALSMYNDPIRSVSETHLHVGEAVSSQQFVGWLVGRIATRVPMFKPLL